MAIGIYVGVATVLGSVWWFTMYEDGPLLSYDRLTHFMECSDANFADFKGANDAFAYPEHGCKIFESAKPMTMALSVLVTIELLNALNSVSEDQSLLVMPPWKNMYLVLADLLSLGLHFVILYVPQLSQLFQLQPLNWDEWQAVLLLSFPVIILDEILKFIARWRRRANQRLPRSAVALSARAE